MKIAVLIFLVLAAHFSLTPFAPGKAGEAKFYWPFAADSRSWLPFIGGLPAQSGSIVTPILAGIAGLAFLAAAASLLGWFVPVAWLRTLVITGAAASALLYMLYIGPYAILPLALDALILWLVFSPATSPALSALLAR